MDLQELVDGFFSDSYVEDYDCSTQDCNGKNARRSTRLCRPLPRTICIHLQRARWNGYMLEKINSRIDFSKELKIKSQFLSERTYLSNCDDLLKNTNTKDSVGFSDSSEGNKEENISFNKNEDEIFYLTSVIVHHGSVYGGHYICHKSACDQWFQTDDSSVYEIKEKDVFGCQAYILFYEKSR